MAKKNPYGPYKPPKALGIGKDETPVPKPLVGSVVGVDEANRRGDQFAAALDHLANMLYPYYISPEKPSSRDTLVNSRAVPFVIPPGTHDPVLRQFLPQGTKGGRVFVVPSSTGAPLLFTMPATTSGRVPSFNVPRSTGVPRSRLPRLDIR